MSATKEAPTQEVQEAPTKATPKESPKTAPYAMPPVERGDVVFYWRDPSAAADPNSGAVGHVTGANSQVISLVVISEWEAGGRKSEVRHASDPLLKTNAFLRKNGCWDYSPQHKRAQAAAQVAAQALEQRIVTIATEAATRIVNEMLLGTKAN